MSDLVINLEGDGALEEWRQDWLTHHKDVDPFLAGHHSTDNAEVMAAYLTGGMESGLPSCIIAARKGRNAAPVFIEMSLQHFMVIAGAFKGRADYEGVEL